MQEHRSWRTSRGRLLAVVVVVVVTPTLPFVSFGSLRDGVNDIIQTLVIEASFLIAITMFLADVLRALLDPRTEARS